VKEFQKKAGLKQDGKYEDQTHAAFMAAVADNDVVQQTQPEPEPEPGASIRYKGEDRLQQRYGQHSRWERNGLWAYHRRC